MYGMNKRRLRPARFDDLHRVQWYRRLAVLYLSFPPSRALVIVIFLVVCRICCRQLTKSTPAVVSCVHRKNFEFFVPLDFLCECVSIYRLIIVC